MPLRIVNLSFVRLGRQEPALLVVGGEILADVEMQEGGHTLIATMGQSPTRRRDGLVEGEVSIFGLGVVRVEPARGVEPEDRAVTVRSQSIDGALRSMFVLPSERPHDEDGNRGRDLLLRRGAVR